MWGLDSGCANCSEGYRLELVKEEKDRGGVMMVVSVRQRGSFTMRTGQVELRWIAMSWVWHWWCGSFASPTLVTS